MPDALVSWGMSGHALRAARSRETGTLVVSVPGSPVVPYGLVGTQSSASRCHAVFVRSIAAGTAPIWDVTVFPLVRVVVYVPAEPARTTVDEPTCAALSAVVVATPVLTRLSPKGLGSLLSAMTVVASRASLTRTVTPLAVVVYCAIGVISPLNVSSRYGVPLPSSVTVVSTAGPVAMQGFMLV